MMHQMGFEPRSYAGGVLVGAEKDRVKVEILKILVDRRLDEMLEEKYLVEKLAYNTHGYFAGGYESYTLDPVFAAKYIKPACPKLDVNESP